MVGQIRKAAVLGSGVMGSGIAALLANVGIPTLLLDIVPRELTEDEKKQGLTLEDKAVRNRISTQSIQKLLKQKPAPLTVRDNKNLIESGNFEDDMERLKDVDWVIEVVVENLDIKKKVFANVEKYRKQGSIVSSNTSGISIEAMSADCSDDFRSNFLGTHFFNPPRYLKLLEVIPTKDTNPEVVAFMKAFAENRLGKGVVEAKDTPNFIANRIGTYGLLVTVNEMVKGGYSVGEVDSVTGPAIGRPSSATFRTLDVVGLDTFLHVAKNVYDQAEGAEKEVFDPPAFMRTMAENGWIGAKAGQGFFLKKKGEKGSEILELDPTTLEYGPRKKLKTKATEAAKQAKGLSNKLKTFVYAEGDRAGELVWNLVKPVLIYSAEKCYEIANDIYSVDCAMKWGFGWEMGPFEMWDAIGVAKSVEKMEAEGETVPAWVKEMLASGKDSFYQEKSFYYKGETKEIELNPKVINIKDLKKADKVIFKNNGASLVDIGDDVALLEFHSPNNSIGLDVLQMINKSIEEVERNYKGLVIGNQGKNFCVGANLMLILMEAQDYNFFELDMVVRQFQKATANIRYSSKPVVVAPHAMTLGGGAEVSLPAASIQASSETYMGLVEVGVGLIPGGGGNKELYLRNLEGDNVDLQKAAIRTFETIAMAKVSTSGDEARANGFLSERDGIIFNGDHVIHHAKQQAIHLHDQGYTAPARNKIPVVGEGGFATLLMGAKQMKMHGMISDHDMKIAEKLAFVIAGGRVPKGALVDEQYLLDLEREAFLSLVGEPKTQMRMSHMLTKGKPLRN